jgi:drug/metabolite transporter superfamily protein YnfA
MVRYRWQHHSSSLWDHPYVAKLSIIRKRVYAAYGGVFVILAVLWGWLIDKKTPDMYDWIGALVCIAGVSIILWAPRS